MVAITAINSATQTLQAALGRSKLQQARREAEQAEATAQNLRQQANVAEQEAQKGQAKVRAIAAQNGRIAEISFGAQGSNRGTLAPASPQDSFMNVYLANRQKQAQDTNALQPKQAEMAVQNLQGQATGRIVNVTA